MNNRDIEDFYNGFVRNQINSGINDRIFQLYKRMLSLGLNTSSNVLELGCGIGTLTFLLSKKVKKGIIEAVDLSSDSILHSKNKINRQNIHFFAADVVTYAPKNKNFDFITLFDVIEHIPMDKHDEMFKSISEIANQYTKILINIPNPEYIEFDSANFPERLQIIDQPIPLDFIIHNLEKNGLQLNYFKTYSIWVENDYQFLIIQKKKKFEEVELHKKRSLIGKTLYHAKRVLLRVKYNYS